MNFFKKDYLPGLLVALILASLAIQLAKLPFLTIMGPLVIAILLGMVWRMIFKENKKLEPGIQFSTKKLLRLGIILLGVQLNLYEIYEAGWRVILLAIFAVVIGFTAVYAFSRLLKVDRKLGILTACGTAICGAAAIIATAPQIKAKNNDIAIATGTIALLGTVFTLVYSIGYQYMNFTGNEYGMFAGSTLHEVAHVVAAGAAGGSEAVDLAVLVKLIRVALLVPVIIFIGFLFAKIEKEQSPKRFSLSMVPWFIFGFAIMSTLNTIFQIPDNIADRIIDVSYLLMGMAMVGIGLNVQLSSFRSNGVNALKAGLYGSIILSVLTFVLIQWIG
ncbi:MULTISPECIES: YeiH family protein [Allobacillus]|uniref:Putative sulfate exporter family transporter n=1 Tax=Allobacillus salarius TaxID=1955272 RepID=A0A556P8U5_9BACI|nr:putative sulfate exporter family transporter [Allobacillus salarius]TSJ60802.1 putative sulfate exporter family transporter [Allobacillus salarius]